MKLTVIFSKGDNITEVLATLAELEAKAPELEVRKYSGSSLDSNRLPSPIAIFEGTSYIREYGEEAVIKLIHFLGE